MVEARPVSCMASRSASQEYHHRPLSLPLPLILTSSSGTTMSTGMEEGYFLSFTSDSAKEEGREVELSDHDQIVSHTFHTH